MRRKLACQCCKRYFLCPFTSAMKRDIDAVSRCVQGLTFLQEHEQSCSVYNQSIGSTIGKNFLPRESRGIRLNKTKWLMTLILCGYLAGVANAQDFTPQRKFVFQYEVVIHEPPAFESQMDIWIPVPSDNPYQKILSLQTESPVAGTIIQEPAYNNRIWHVTLTQPFPEFPLRITQRVEVVRFLQQPSSRRPVHSHSISETIKRYLKPARLIPNSKNFRDIAHSIVKEKPHHISIGRALYNHVIRKMSYDKTGTGWGRGDADYACLVGKGNCTDYHSYFIALARSIDIPARFWIGFPLPESRGNRTVSGYHCWAEFYSDADGWIPVDISEGDKHPEKSDFYFGHLDPNRIAYTYGRDIQLPASQSASLNFFVYPHVEIDGTPSKKVESHFSFQDLP